MSTPRNLIVIIADTFRADHIGCYGSARVKTPNLDRLAEEGVRFANCYADGLPTIPCRRVLHTGRSIIPMRTKGGWVPLNEDRRTLAQVLSDNGFRTALVADTYHHFKPGMNFHRGFDSWEWIRGQETDAWRSGPQSRVDPREHMPEHLWNPGYDQQMRQYLLNTLDWETEDDGFCARSFGAGLDWLDSNSEAERFMLWIDTFDPHEPWDAPPRFQRMYLDDYGYKRFLFGYGVRHGDIRDEDIPIIQALYAAEVSYVDDRIGKFLEGVREMGLLEDTAVVFSTDHGTHVGDEGCVQKTPGLLNSCVAQLPLIVRHPDSAGRGQVVDELVSAVDYMPGILSMMGVEDDVPLDGASFWDLANGTQDRLHEYVVTEFADFAAVRDGDWHYFQNASDPAFLNAAHVEGFAARVPEGGPGVPHLCDLAADPGEKTNVVLDHPDVVEQAQERLREVYR